MRRALAVLVVAVLAPVVAHVAPAQAQTSPSASQATPATVPVQNCFLVWTPYGAMPFCSTTAVDAASLARSQREYLSNGATVTGVPSSGPAAAYFHDGSHAMGSPTWPSAASPASSAAPAATSIPVESLATPALDAGAPQGAPSSRAAGVAAPVPAPPVDSVESALPFPPPSPAPPPAPSAESEASDAAATAGGGSDNLTLPPEVPRVAARSDEDHVTPSTAPSGRWLRVRRVAPFLTAALTMAFLFGLTRLARKVRDPRHPRNARAR